MRIKMWWCKYGFLILLFISFSLCLIRPNVCRNFPAYGRKYFSSECWFNPDVDSKPEFVAQRYGCELMTYIVTTKDGYHLQLFRLQNKIDNEPKQPIFLMHDMFTTAMSFMLVGNRSLAFYLSHQGYDVWLGNMRGSTYSVGNTVYTRLSPKFWRFSFQEVVTHDISAFLSYIRKKTSKKSIYIGHGMGATTAFMLALDTPDQANYYLKGIISLGAVDSALKIGFSEKHRLLLRRQYRPRSKYFNVLFPIREPLQFASKILCQNYPTIQLCKLLLFFVSGFSYYEILPEDIPMIFSYFPSSISVDMFLQYLQITSTLEMRKFDYGPAQNLRIYGSLIPPAYDYLGIKLPVHIYYGDNDKFSGGKPVAEALFAKLGCINKTITGVPEELTSGYTHFDFLVGRNVHIYLYPKLLKVIEDLEKIN